LVANAADDDVDEVGVLAQRAFVRAPVAGPVHRPPEVRPELDRQQARLVRPVLEQPPAAEQPRHDRLVERTDARAERQPVGTVDRRDRVELHRRQPAHRGLDVVDPRAPEARRESLPRYEEAAQRRDAHGHAISPAPTSWASDCTGFSIGTGSPSQWTALTRSTPCFRSTSGSMRPTRRSPWRIGRTKYPCLRCAFGT